MSGNVTTSEIGFGEVILRGLTSDVMSRRSASSRGDACSTGVYPSYGAETQDATCCDVCSGYARQGQFPE